MQRVHPSSHPPQRVTLLGATGSIGASSLRVIAAHPDRFRIAALTAHENAEQLMALAQTFRPEMVAIGNPDHAPMLRAALAPYGIRVAAGAEGLLEAAALPTDITIAAIVGTAGLPAIIEAAKQGHHLALANKESLVCAGALLLGICAAHGTQILPLDSEHNAIFQVLQGAEYAVEKLTLTASGGPLLHRPLETMDSVTIAEAVNHPRWSMGAKISVDSATMMNKGLELIEAHYLFGTPESQLDVLIHPQSIVHSLVHFTDGSVLAQLGMPDMAIPIAYALGWPERIAAPTPRLDLARISTLTFAEVADDRFPAIGLARHALREGAAQQIAFNAANEVAVAAFLEGRIPFPSIVRSVARVMEHCPAYAVATMEDVLASDAELRILAREML